MWALVKKWQGIMHHNSVPPKVRADVSTATSTDDKATLIAKLFAENIQTDGLGRLTVPPPETGHAITSFEVPTQHVEKVLRPRGENTSPT